MGFFGKLFGNSEKNNDITLFSPVTGKIVEASEIPDPTFADNILGPCIGIKPTKGVVVAPCDGKVEQIFKTGHAATIVSKDGVEILVHVGINTVDLKGEGFEALVEEGAEVTLGTPLIKFDIDLIESKGFNTVVPLVICNPTDFGNICFSGQGPVTAKDDKLATILRK